ncbi:MAG: Rrf2 family transcriptional regulator [Proteobacteria bacterium]|nr:Rrf2 family transcriptional regulator [Pseudomonadota bacterium]
MLELSINPDHPVTLSYLSRLQNISISYLEQIFAQLRKHELVKSVRGPGGGYVLNRAMADITVGDVVKAIDNISALSQGEPSDKTHSLWNQLSTLVYQHLDTISLADIHHAAENVRGVHQAA